MTVDLETLRLIEYPICQDAATELEQLRARIKQLEHELDVATEFDDCYGREWSK